MSESGFSLVFFSSIKQFAFVQAWMCCFTPKYLEAIVRQHEQKYERYENRKSFCFIGSGNHKYSHLFDVLLWSGANFCLYHNSRPFRGNGSDLLSFSSLKERLTINCDYDPKSITRKIRKRFFFFCFGLSKDHIHVNNIFY